MLQVLNAFISTLFLLSQIACESAPQSGGEVYAFPYSLNSPDQSFQLDSTLTEISGLSGGFRQRLLAINDEVGTLFLLDAGTGMIRESSHFHKDADYEGVEMVGDQVFVIRSSGTLYALEHPFTEGQQMVKYNTILDRSYDVEGLGYDPDRQALLIGCKGLGPDEKAYTESKPIFGFDLNTKELMKTPLFLVHKAELFAYIQAHPDMDDYDELIEEYAPDVEKFDFGPSGLAWHPQTKELYVLSSPGRLLAVLSPEGKLVHVQKLRKKVHAQPEGICFDEQGNLWISSAAKCKSPAILHKF
ncbi:MAG: SdiA-regulated domain-containing protein, partial [Phaeodactylibacter sp.]|nr:SdiA-regulated domain-containing protein [Phaeodactylibacter sp.]